KAEWSSGCLPPGLDDNHFSALAKVLPYLGEEELYRRIDFNKSIDDPANRAARRTTVGVFLSPLDDAPLAGNDPTKAYGPTNYLLNGLAFRYRWCEIYPGGFTDGCSQTVCVIETLRGRPTEGPDVRRQYLILGEKETAKYRVRWHVPTPKEGTPGDKHWKVEDQNRWDEVGVNEFDAGKNIVTNRGASWMDGSPLQTVLLPGRGLNDPLPDAIVGTPERMEGVSGPRSLTHDILVSMADGSVCRFSDRRMSDQAWFDALTPSAGTP